MTPRLVGPCMLSHAAEGRLEGWVGGGGPRVEKVEEGREGRVAR